MQGEDSLLYTNDALRTEHWDQDFQICTSALGLKALKYYNVIWKAMSCTSTYQSDFNNI